MVSSPQVSCLLFAACSGKSVNDVALLVTVPVTSRNVTSLQPMMLDARYCEYSKRPSALKVNVSVPPNEVVHRAKSSQSWLPDAATMDQVPTRAAGTPTAPL